MKPQVFTIVPGTSGPVWILVGVAALLLVMVGLFAWLAYSSRSTRFEVSPAGLTIDGTMYGRTIPAGSIDLDGIEVLDLRRDREHRPKWRTNGAGLPGYLAGWFRLRNGEKSLLFVTDKSRVVYVPTAEGFSVMASVPQPERFKAALEDLGRND